MQPLVSVIIPVYKVEKYLNECLDSVCNQTYQNLEIILIDDGSPDNCGKICDEYAAKDNRIIVIHQANQGISAARNAGLDICKGEYISFVDSDDWVDANFIELLLKNASRDTIVECGFVRHQGNKQTNNCAKSECVYTVEAAIDVYFATELYPIITPYVSNKLYPRFVFENLRFPTGINYEDLYIFTDTLEQCNFIHVLPLCAYHYRIREGSICRNNTKKNAYDRLVARQRQFDVLKNSNKQFNIRPTKLINGVIYVYKYYSLGCYNLDECEKMELQKIVKENFKSLSFGTKIWLKAFLYLYCKPLLKLLFQIRKS